MTLNVIVGIHYVYFLLFTYILHLFYMKLENQSHCFLSYYRIFRSLNNFYKRRKRTAIKLLDKHIYIFDIN